MISLPRHRPAPRAVAKEIARVRLLAPAALALALCACASAPPAIAPTAGIVNLPPPAVGALARPITSSPVFDAPRVTLPANATRPAPTPAPLPTSTGVPPAGEVERQEVRDATPRVARIDLTVQPDDLWQRMRQGFGMADLDSTIVQDKVAWYAARPEYLRRTFERSRLYLYHIVEELEKRGMPTELALLPMVESSFNPMAYSRAHASGLWQFIPPTGRRYSLEQNWWFDGRRDIVASTSAALDYLRDIYEMHGDWHLALASYNWGENAVARAIERNKGARLPTDYSSLNMPLETRQYVPKLQALKNIIANPAPFGINLDPIPNQPYFTTVTKMKDIDLKLAASLAEMSIGEFVALNPGYNRPLMPLSVSTRIVLPADKVKTYHANLVKFGDKALVSWQTYRLAQGEKLDSIAKRFGIPLSQLKEVNGLALRNRQIPALLIVPSRKEAIGGPRLPIMYAPPIAARPAPPPRPTAVTHVVQLGDTLSSIATRYGVSVDDIRRGNKIGRLQAGQQIVIRKPAGTRVSKKTLQKSKSKNKVRNKNKVK